MRTTLKRLVFAVLLLGFVTGISQPAKGCDRSRLTLDSITPAPGGTFYIYLRLCVGAGILGLLKGADGNTGRFLFSFSSSTPGFAVTSFTSPITSDFTGVPYAGVNVGAQPAFNAQQAIFYNNSSNWFACITSTLACGSPNTECDQVRFQVNSLPDSIRIYGIEGGDNLFGGCYPNISMLIDFTGLPVEYQDFTARQEGREVLLDWATVFEYNNKEFEITRSSDGINFETIGTVAPQYTPGKTGSYSFIDRNPRPGINHYRLRQIDFDGATSESQSITVNYAPESGLVWESVAPNPTDDFMKLVFRTEEMGSMDLKMVDVQGRSLINRRVQVEAGMNELTLDVRELAAGIYYLRLSNTAGMLEKKVIVM